VKIRLKKNTIEIYLAEDGGGDIEGIIKNLRLHFVLRRNNHFGARR
jgi:hypothetical protein